MKTLNDFKNENNDLSKLEMAQKFGGRHEEPELTAEDNSNWNCGDVKTCTTVFIGDGNSIVVCNTTALPDTGQ